jgi:hypothetical protein
MLADMTQGLQVYLLPARRTAERLPTAPTLGPAPLHEVGALAEQDAFQQRWQTAPTGRTPDRN